MEGIIRFAKTEDIPALKSLWQSAFGDTPEGTLFYFARRHKNQNMLVYEMEGRPVAMLSMLPVTLNIAGQQLPGRYVFGVATDEKWRGKGISSQLLDRAHHHMRDMGAKAALLAPAEQSLFAFYEKRGYQTLFYADTATVRGADLLPYAGQCRDATLDEFASLRDAAFSDSQLYAQWDREALRYILASAKLYGSAVLYARDGDMEGCALVEPMDAGRVRVTDMALKGMMPLHFLAALHHAVRAEEYVLRVAEDLWPGATKQPLGMIHPLAKLPKLEGTPPYLALIKD